MSEGGSTVVFVVLDTVRKDHLTVYGYDRPTSPALGRFATDATVFEHAVAPAPWTLPVHASLFTGRYPSEHGATQENPYLDGIEPLAATLSAGGYATACYSSNAWITPYTGLTAGFDAQDNFFELLPGDLLSGPLAALWRRIHDHDQLRSVANRLVELGNKAHEYVAGSDRSDSKTPQAIDRAIEFLDAHEEAFVFLNLMDAHLPYMPPARYAEEFAPGVDPGSVCQNSKEYNARARGIDADEWASIRGLYDAEIRHADAELGRLFAWLEANDRWDEALVIVCADHGELHGEHDLFGHEFGLYDPVVNVPLLVKHPDLPTGRRNDQVELLDLYHTVVDHAGRGGSEFVPERSLLDESYREFDGAEEAFVEYSRPVIELTQLESKARAAGVDLDPQSRFYSRMRAVRRVDAKYIEHERIDDEFYRLDTDPGESVDRAGRGGETERILRETLRGFVDRVGADWTAAGDPTGLDGMDRQTLNRLRELGYLE